ncbi:MAG: FtsW/RodA/SpoVE family cell cycle protein [Elusimicrobia bacterium]|nr:FtsW/RodA/SpoVE family cell cycle protein [Elusimicrobiota bacterium]
MTMIRAVRAQSGMSGRVDWTFVAAMSGLIVAGSLAMLSAASTTVFYDMILKKHFVALALGAVLFTLTLAFNYQVFQDQSKFMYGTAILIVAATLILGKISRGQRSWVHLLGFSFQPAEMARTLVILALADFLDRRARRAGDLSTILLTLAIAGPVMALILKQPDFSTTLTFVPAIFGMLFCAGADLFQLLVIFGYGGIAISVPLIYTICQVRYPLATANSLPSLILATSRMGWATLATILIFCAIGFMAWRLATWMRVQVKPAAFAAIPILLSAALLSGIFVHRQLKGYQRNRFVAWVAPHTDVQGAAYNVIQSQIAIGSGGLWGKGLFSGTQSKLGFLPERHTDFVFANVGEEMGFWGSSLILGLYMLLLWRVVAASRLAPTSMRGDTRCFDPGGLCPTKTIFPLSRKKSRTRSLKTRSPSPLRRATRRPCGFTTSPRPMRARRRPCR